MDPFCSTVFDKCLHYCAKRPSKKRQKGVCFSADAFLIILAFVPVSTPYGSHVVRIKKLPQIWIDLRGLIVKSRFVTRLWQPESPYQEGGHLGAVDIL